MQLEIVGMIYRSVRYLDFMLDQLDRYSDGIDWRIVANDPTPEVRDRLTKSGAVYSIYNDPHPDDFYLRRVYRCINWYYANSRADVIIETQSDMAYSDGWAEALICAYTDDTIPVSRLVHPFDVAYKSNLVGDFGYPGSFREEEWIDFAARSKRFTTEPGGLYCPRLMDVSWFLYRGGFPEGNLNAEGGIADDVGVRSSDEFFFSNSGKQHITVYDSLVYHIGEGELKDK